ARERRGAEAAARLERRQPLARDDLRGRRVRLVHGQVVRELCHPEVMPAARDRLRLAHQLGEREVLARVGPGAEAVPGGDAVASDAAGHHLSLEYLEGGADTGQEVLAGNAAELRLGVVHVVDVDAGEAQVAEAPPELVL